MDERINKIVVFWDYKKLQLKKALINYTQKAFNGEEKDFVITVYDENKLKYYEEILANQNKCASASLERLGKEVFIDSRMYDPNKNYFSNASMLEVDKLLLSPKKNTKPNIKYNDPIEEKRKKRIRITSIAAATIVLLGTTGFVLGDYFSLKNKALRAVCKIETNGESKILKDDLMDISRYVESESNDSRFQQEEIDLNDRVLFGLAKNEYDRAVIKKAQGLFKNCILGIDGRYRYSDKDVYNYFMYMTSLFKNGDDFYNSSAPNFTIADVMRDSYEVDKSEKAQDFTNNGNVSVQRIMYSATKSEASTFNGMPLIAKKILMEQFLTVCKNMNIELIKEDYPSWWVGQHMVYSKEKIYDEIKDRCEQIEGQLTNYRENGENSSKKL